MENSYDVIIAGGGLAGILAAVKLHQAQPDLSILLLEKEAQLGGRLRRQDVANNQWNYGFYAIHAALFDVWDQLLKTDPEAPDLPTYARGTVEDGGILAAQHITPINVRQLFSPEGARAIAGGALARFPQGYLNNHSPSAGQLVGGTRYLERSWRIFNAIACGVQNQTPFRRLA